MYCPNCQSQNWIVTDSRHNNDPDVNAIRRRRVCADCDTGYTTYEFIKAENGNVIKLKGRRNKPAANLSDEDLEQLKAALDVIYQKFQL